jgi:hypothetical protein
MAGFSWEFNGELETLWNLCLRIMITMITSLHIINSYIPSVNQTVCKLENDHRNSGFTHGKW